MKISSGVLGSETFISAATAKKISDGTEVAVKLLAVSYRYVRSKKVQHFICTTGNVTLGRPYLAKFKDASILPAALASGDFPRACPCVFFT